MEHYAIAAFRDTDEFLFNLATKFNKFKKGGVPDPSAAARMVLQDWNEGGIPYYTLPPRTRPSAHESAEIVAQFGEWRGGAWSRANAAG
jgi:nuclear GTP-binding protein